MAIEWQMDEPGWYTSEIGGIVSNGKSWSFWPLDESVDELGPWPSLVVAKEAAEAWHATHVSNGERADG